MKKILLLGNLRKEDTAINNAFKNGKYKITRTNNANNALKILHDQSPDFVLCTGKFLKTKDGQYYLEI